MPTEIDLALQDRRIIETSDARSREVFHSFTKGMCPKCRELVDCQRVIRDQKVYLKKQCSRCGPSQALISGDAEWFLKSLTYTKKGSVPLQFSTKVDRGCPHDCGLCPDHEQHSCLPIIEITNHCNLECPVCIVQNRDNYIMTEEEYTGIIDGLIAKEGFVDTVNLSGGEPTMHPKFMRFLDIATERDEIARVSISTNGLQIAQSLEFCEELARRRVYVNLQMDALRNPALQALRGGGNHQSVKWKALDNLEKAGVPTTIIATIAKGVNDDEIGDCVRLLYERDFILSLLFQPTAYTGYGGAHFGPHDPLDVITIPDIVNGAAAQTDGELLREDFLPLPCSHPGCFALTYLLKTDDGFVPFPRFVELDKYMEVIANRGTIAPDDNFEGAIRNAIDELWSSSGQIPDSQKILTTLKKAIKLMYPPDRALELEERIAIGEGLVKTIFIHAYMDEHTFDVDRIKKCCTHYAMPDGKLMPGCAYNMFYRHKDPRYTGPKGETRIWGKGAEGKDGNGNGNGAGGKGKPLPMAGS